MCKREKCNCEQSLELLEATKCVLAHLKQTKLFPSDISRMKRVLAGAINRNSNESASLTRIDDPRIGIDYTFEHEKGYRPIDNKNLFFSFEQDCKDYLKTTEIK